MTRPRTKVLEERADTARSSLLVLLVSALLGLAAVAASVAQAVQPPIPALNGTTPSSNEFVPALELEPLIFGEGEPSGGHTSSPVVTAFGSTGDPVSKGTKNPQYEIKIYREDPLCTSTPAAEGPASELESPGIKVKVSQDSITTFYARQVDLTDPLNPSNCSEGRTYWEGAVAVPPPPTEGPPAGGGPPTSPPGPGGSAGPPPSPQLRTIPGGSANDNIPLVTGSAPGAATVRIFTDPSCKGAPVAKGSAAQFAAGLQVQVVNNVVVAFYGVSVGPGGAQSTCSQPVYYVEDSTAPHTRITMGPASKTRRHTAVFRFTDTTGNGPGTAFFCKVNRGRWKRCSSPLRMRRLHLERYTLHVKAVDAAGNAEVKGAVRRFKVVPPL